jgi:uncharacterized membrane protein YfcA
MTAVLLFAGGVAGGLFGAVLGIGGGVLIVPLLTLGFQVPLAAAVGVSLVCVVATSTGAAAWNVRAGRADVRLAIYLEVGTVFGALAAGFAAPIVPDRLLAAAFAILMVYVGIAMTRSGPAARITSAADPAVDASAPDGPGAPTYRSHRLPEAVAGSVGAGVISALLGVGGGVVKVPLLRLVMGVPLHIASATSSFIIGVTAAAGAYPYLLRGQVDPSIAGPMVLGVAAGAAAGAALAPRLRARWLALLFAAVAAYVAIQMALRAAGVGQ